MACQNDIYSTSQNIMQLSKYDATFRDISYFESCMIYSTKWNNVLKVA